MVTYITALIIFLFFDFLWLTVLAKGFYEKNLGSITKTEPNLIAAGFFYLIFIAGLVTFVIQPALFQESGIKALGLGAFFGLVTYATFDLTSLALLKGFSVRVVLVDLFWGMFIGGAVSSLTYYIIQSF